VNRPRAVPASQLHKTPTANRGIMSLCLSEDQPTETVFDTYGYVPSRRRPPTPGHFPVDSTAVPNFSYPTSVYLAIGANAYANSPSDDDEHLYPVAEAHSSDSLGASVPGASHSSASVIPPSAA
jgi:hypothetical protein